jgi:uncharacterized membrane protein
MQQLSQIYKNYTPWIFLGILLCIIGSIMLGCLLLPSLFYDQWIWKYYWGPVVSDAQGTTAWYHGVPAHEGYTFISEVTYGIILVIALFAIYQLLKKLHIVVDWRFALALLPYIIFGPVGRTLEDTGYFSEPLVYWFISPLIYVQIAVYALCFVLLGYWLEKKLKRKYITVNTIVCIGGLLFLLPSLIPIIQWIVGVQWNSTTGVRFDVFLIVIGLTSLIVGLVYSLSFLFKNQEHSAVYRNPLNLSMLFGHLIDGLTSYISIKDPFSMGLFYSEKHPASNMLLEVWGPLFPIVKFSLIIIIIYVFDILYKEELEDYSRLVNLLKIGILILGFSPGLRDLLRVTMGV